MFDLRPLVPVLLACSLVACRSTHDHDAHPHEPAQGQPLLFLEVVEPMPLSKLQYLEYVTPEVDATCALLADVRGLIFGEPVPELGFARTAELTGVGLIGVRAPMHAMEQPAIRPYFLVDDIAAAVEAARAAGAEIAVPPMPIPGRGQCAVYFLGGVEHGLWQL